jgi:hypothetical protein
MKILVCYNQPFSTKEQGNDIDGAITGHGIFTVKKLTEKTICEIEAAILATMRQRNISVFFKEGPVIVSVCPLQEDEIETQACADSSPPVIS